LQKVLEKTSTKIIGTAFAAVIFASLSGSAYATIGGAHAAGEDDFGITKVYPTKEGGREWFIDMDDPEDEIFDPRATIEKQSDGSWRVSGHDNGKYQVRMNVYTPEGSEEWKNVEITGYAKVFRTVGHSSGAGSDLENVLQWYARSGAEHSDSDPCDGTSIKGRLHLDGTVGWKKEIWHTGGYTDERGAIKAIEPVVDERNSKGRYYDGTWFGFKVVIYNIENDSAVKMEAYIDEHATNEWKKVSELVDDGGWYADSKKFGKEDCDRTRDHVLTEAGQVVAFRSDKIVWDFKDLSVREIQPPVQDSSVLQFAIFPQ
jgi:hypothetical protein